ncbi:MAG: hypothetical protein WD229_15855, partial [Pirellulales bacterium]
MDQPIASMSDEWGSSASRKSGGTANADPLLRVVDAGLLGVICVAPFFFGGRHDLGRLVLVTLIALSSAAWFARQALLPAARWPRTIAHLILFLAVALLVLQIVPLPPDWIAQLSPKAAELLPISVGDSDPTRFGPWQTMSLSPHETTKSLAMLLSYGLLFVVVTGRIETSADVQRLMNWIALSAS